MQFYPHGSFVVGEAQECAGSKPYPSACSFPCAGCASLEPAGIPALHPCWGIRIAIAPGVTEGSIKPLITEQELPFVALRAADLGRLTGSEAALRADANREGAGPTFKGTLASSGSLGYPPGWQEWMQYRKPARLMAVQLLKPGEMRGHRAEGFAFGATILGPCIPCGHELGLNSSGAVESRRGSSGLSISRKGNCAPTVGCCSVYGFVILLTWHCVKVRSLGASSVRNAAFPT